MSKYSVLITSPIEDEALEVFHSSSIDVIMLREPPTTEFELLQYIGDVDAALVVRGVEPFTRKVIESAKRLKIIARSGVGYDKIDVEAATEKGIWVTIAPVEEFFEAVADHVFALMLCLVRKICKAGEYVKKGLWISNSHESLRSFIGTNLRGKIMGIIGLGNIGSRVARRAKAFGMKVLYYDIVRKEDLEREGVEFVPLRELLAQSDFIIIAVPLTKQTINMISYNEFELMKREAIIINIARGPIINHEALIKALKNHRIAGAALDVFYQEPLPTNDPILNLDNVVLTPHIAAFTREARKALIFTAIDEILRVLKGEKPRYAVNKIRSI